MFNLSSNLFHCPEHLPMLYMIGLCVNLDRASFKFSTATHMKLVQWNQAGDSQHLFGHVEFWNSMFNPSGRFTSPNTHPCTSETNKTHQEMHKHAETLARHRHTTCIYTYIHTHEHGRLHRRTRAVTLNHSIVKWKTTAILFQISLLDLNNSLVLSRAHLKSSQIKMPKKLNTCDYVYIYQWNCSSTLRPTTQSQN